MANWAFFSYARADGPAAEKLHSALDRYRTPRDLVGTAGAHGPVPAKLHPVFRDVSDLSGGGHLNEKIERALANTTCLVVLCSPAAAASPWVDRECQTFIDQGKAARIFPVIAPDLPAAGERDERFEETYFPACLRGKGFLAADLRETKAASGKPIGDGDDNGRTKLIAGLLGVALDALVKREQRRQRRLVAMLSATALVFAGVAAAAVWQTVAANNERAEATRQRGIAVENANTAEKRRLEAEEYARQREEQRAIADQQRQLANRNAEQARIQELAAVANAKEASAQRDQARNSLARIFAERSWDALRRGDYPLAARYALAGRREFAIQQRDVEAVSSLFRSVLGSILYETTDSRVFTGHEDRIHWAEFSPDGKRVVSASADGSARVWDTESGKQVFLLGHPDAVERANFSPDGSRIATALSEGSEGWLWDASTGSEITPLSGHNAKIGSISFSPDGTKLVTASDDGTARVWDSSNGREITVLSTGQAPIRAVAFSPDSHLIVTALGISFGNSKESNSLQIWQASTGRRLAILIGHQDAVEAVQFSPDGKQVVSASSDGTAVLWDIISGRALAKLVGHKDRIGSVQFSPDGTQLLTASDDGTARIWNTNTGRQILGIAENDSPIRSAAFNHDGSRVLSLSTGALATVWDVSTGREVASLGRHQGAVASALFSRDGSRIVTSSSDFTVRVWDALDFREILSSATGPLWQSVQMDNSSTAPRNARNRLIIFAQSTVQILNAATGQEVLSLNAPRPLVAAVLSPNGRSVVTVDKANEEESPESFVARLWDVSSGRQTFVLRGGGSSVTFAEFSPDESRLATGSGDGSVRIWDTTNGLQIGLLGAYGSAKDPEHVLNAVFSQDGSKLALTYIGDVSQVKRVWNISRLTQPMAELAIAACTNFLLLQGRRFSDLEIGADPLIRDVWLREGQPNDRDVCESVPGVAPLPAG